MDSDQIKKDCLEFCNLINNFQRPFPAMYVEAFASKIQSYYIKVEKPTEEVKVSSVKRIVSKLKGGKHGK